MNNIMENFNFEGVLQILGEKTCFLPQFFVTKRSFLLLF
jgi:hypothetical protein